MLHVCSTTVLLRAALSELQRLESLPACPRHLSLSLRPFLAPCACFMSALLQFSSELHYQSCNAQSLLCPSLQTLRGTPSLLAVSVWPLRERFGQSTVIVTVNCYRSTQAVAARECFTNVCRMFWQGALPRKFANFKVQNDECHN